MTTKVTDFLTSPEHNLKEKGLLLLLHTLFERGTHFQYDQIYAATRDGEYVVRNAMSTLRREGFVKKVNTGGRTGHVLL